MYCFLNYSRNDFVIDLDEIWQWCGFSQKINAKKVLEKNFILNRDYKSLLCQLAKQKKERGGSNKEKLMLTVTTFKLFCMKAGTKKAEQIHEYYIKLEETLQEVINEECNKLREQIEYQCRKIENNEEDKKLLCEKTLLQQFPDNTQCIYYGIIDNKTDINEPLIKFGHSNNLKNRIEKHKNTFINFYLVNAYKVDNKVQIENAIKQDSLLKTLRRTICINNRSQTELLSIQNISCDEINKKIEEIIHTIEYNPENYNKILQENSRIKREYALLMDKYNNIMKKMDNINNKKINKISTPHVRKYQKDKDGYYYIHDNKYQKLIGSREEVWKKIAYKTTGELVREDLHENQKGKIISKNKHIYSKINNNLDGYNNR